MENTHLSSSGSTLLSEKLAIKKILSHVAISAEEELEILFRPNLRKVIILAGPTGVGKTALSIKLAALLGGEIVSADSAQVYRGMDIGTAKISKEEKEGIPHHLIDIRDLSESFNVADFYKEARQAIISIQKRGKVPIVVGGTGFYLHALIYGPPEGPGKDEKIREQLEADFEKLGIDPLFDRLQEFDPRYASTISKQDVHKVLRALEIIQISGKPVSSFEWKERNADSYFSFHPWFLYRDREQLYPILDNRSLEMVKKGLVEEVIGLEKKGLRQNSTAAQAIGYKQTLEFLDSNRTEADYKQYIAKLQAATRQLAKRQFTWFKKEPLFRWIDVGQYTLEALIKRIIVDFESSEGSHLDTSQEDL